MSEGVYGFLDKLYTLSGLNGIGNQQDTTMATVMESNHGFSSTLDNGFGIWDLTRPWMMYRMLGTGEVRNLLFWMTVISVLVLFGTFGVFGLYSAVSLDILLI
jgi:hypothetical protein